MLRNFYVKQLFADTTISKEVEKILKGSLDSITFKEPWTFEFFVLFFIWQNVAGHCQQTFENKKFVAITQQCFALLPQVNFPTNNLNFQWRWRWWDRIQAIYLNLFYFTKNLWMPLMNRSKYYSGGRTLHPWPQSFVSQSCAPKSRVSEERLSSQPQRKNLGTSSWLWNVRKRSELPKRSNSGKDIND